MTTAYTFDPEHVHHAEDRHPEHPARLAAVMSRLRDTGWLKKLVHVEPVSAPLEAIERVHPEPYAITLESFCVRGGGLLDTDTFVTEASFRVARRGCGGIMTLVDGVLGGDFDNAFALTRPPGHHARPFAAMGFCLFANLAIAARHAQQVHGIERVLIVDFDVHHGNGTQEIFYDDPNVLVFSSHQDPAYPGTGAIDETGAGRGVGATLNLPYPPGTTDAALVDAYRKILIPAADRFRPELVLVAAGFDGHHLDPLAHTGLSATGFADLMRVILDVADRHCAGRVVAALEGGYHPSALAESVRACLTVMEDPAAEVDDPLGQPEVGGRSLEDVIEAVSSAQRL